MSILFKPASAVPGTSDTLHSAYPAEADLPIDAILDGEFIKRSGGLIVGEALAETKKLVIELSHADITGLSVAPFELVPAPAVDKVIELVAAAYFFDWTIDYVTAGVPLNIGFSDVMLLDSGIDTTVLLAAGHDTYAPSFPLPDTGIVYAAIDVAGQPLYLLFAEPALTGGDPANVLRIIIYYRINDSGW